jgi:hypothetical protein
VLKSNFLIVQANLLIDSAVQLCAVGFDVDNAVESTSLCDTSTQSTTAPGLVQICSAFGINMMGGGFVQVSNNVALPRVV